MIEQVRLWDSFSDDEKEDALRVTVKPHAAESFEVLTYVFDDIKPDFAAATLRWEKLAIPFRISADVKAVVSKCLPTSAAPPRRIRPR